MLFTSWSGVARVFVVGTLAYAALLLVLRASGKRTLSKMNAFDLVVTVALGSSLATALLSKQVALIEGVAAFVLLTALQFALTWGSVRSATLRRLVKSEPALLFYKGEFQLDALRRERLTEGEVRAAVRQSGCASLERIEAIVLETAGDISVIRGHEGTAGDALIDAGVHQPPSRTSSD